jgi:hypothetical protein
MGCRVWAVALVCGLVAVAGCSVRSPARSAGVPAPARPGCGPPNVALVGPTSLTADRQLMVVLDGRVGKPVVVTVRVVPVFGVRMVSGALTVAKPGTMGYGFNTRVFSRSPTSVELADSELVRTPVVADPAGYALVSLRFTPPAPGTYPVIVGGTYTETADCSATAPVVLSPGGGGVGLGEFWGEVGTIVVR